MRLGVDEPEEVVLLVRRRNAPNGYENVAVAPKGFDLAGHVAAHPFDRLALIGRAVDVRDHRSGDDNMQREGLGPGRQLEVRDDALADEPFEGAGQGRIAHGGTTPNREHAFARLGPLEVPVPSPALHGSEPPHSLSSLQLRLERLCDDAPGSPYPAPLPRHSEVTEQIKLKRQDGSARPLSHGRPASALPVMVNGRVR